MKVAEQVNLKFSHTKKEMVIMCGNGGIKQPYYSNHFKDIKSLHCTLPLHLHNVICQLYFNKATKQKIYEVES